MYLLVPLCSCVWTPSLDGRWRTLTLVPIVTQGLRCWRRSDITCETERLEVVRGARFGLTVPNNDGFLWQDKESRKVVVCF